MEVPILDNSMNTVCVSPLHPWVSSPAVATDVAQTKMEHVTPGKYDSTLHVTGEQTKVSAQ